MTFKSIEVKQSFIDFLIYEKNFSPKTYLSYDNDISQLVAFLSKQFEVEDIRQIKLIHLRSFISHLKTNHCESSTIQRKGSSLKSFFKYCMQKDLLSSNPSFGLVLPKKKKRLPVFTEQNIVQHFEHYFDASDDLITETEKLIFLLFYHTGIRRAELINTKIGDIDFDDNKIKVLGKGNKERFVPLQQEFAQRIQKFIKLKSSNKMNVNKDSFLFSDKNNKPYYPKKVYRVIHKMLSLFSSITKKSPHVLRHSFANELLNNGANINDIKELLGHANIAATQVYTNTSIQNLKNTFKEFHPKA